MVGHVRYRGEGLFSMTRLRGGAGGSHPLTAAGAFGVLLLDTVVYATAAWYAESEGSYTRPLSQHSLSRLCH
jgi:hypothetical protein